MEAGRTRRRALRPSIGVRFTCNGTYIRLWRHPDAKMYRGHCPRCMAALRIEVSPQGAAADVVSVTCR